MKDDSLWLESVLGAKIDAISGGGGGNPTGGTVNIATLNQELALISTLQGLSAGSVLKGLPTALLDTLPANGSTINQAVANPGNTFELTAASLKPISYLKYLFHFEGTGTTGATITQAAVAWPASGYPDLNGDNGGTFDTVNFKFGTSSLSFNGTSNGYQWAGGSGSGPYLSNYDFTFDTWIYLNGAPGTFTVLSSGNSSQSDKSFSWDIISAGMQFRYSTDGSTTITIASDTVSWNTSQWYHIAITRSGNNCYMFRDGVLISTSLSITGTLHRPTGNFSSGLGYDWATSQRLNAKLDELAIRIGTAFYTSTFTPPVAAYSSLEIAGLNGATGITSLAQFVPSGLSSFTMYLVIDTHYEAITINTDLILSLSLDNGSTYHTMTLTKYATYSTGSIFLYKAIATVSGYTNTNQFMWKLTDANGKRYVIKDVVATWS